MKTNSSDPVCFDLVQLMTADYDFVYRFINQSLKRSFTVLYPKIEHVHGISLVDLFFVDIYL